jgi:hypothetical protein
MALTMVVLPTPGRMLDYLESVEKGKRFLLNFKRSVTRQ